MDCIANRLPYRQTNAFTRFAVDYIDQSEALKPFFAYSPTLQGILRSIEVRQKLPTNRKILVEVLKKQYGGLLDGKTSEHVEALLAENTFTITTAHQPALLTGPLYFIYKILHAIKLASELRQAFPQYQFVPVYYMGSEDADLEELNHIYIDDQKRIWATGQTGAVGRMKIDAAFLQLVDDISGQLEVLPFGKDIVDTIRSIFRKDMLVQEAMFRLVHELFKQFGLVVLIPDNPALKKLAVSLFEDDLLQQRPSEIVGKTIEKISAAGYKTQAHPREINLFYLADGIRERIVKDGSRYSVQGTDIEFSQEGMKKELASHPERFSPNVILRGIFQEMILPNIAFIGGGAEIAYWMQYGDLFRHYKVPYPVLVLRNSFLIVEKNTRAKAAKLGFSLDDLFLPEQELINSLVVRESKNETRLNGSLPQMEQLYELLKQQASQVDVTLSKHVDALKVHAVHRLQELEKKMLRAEKRKFADQQRQIHSIKSKLFPGDGLQERHDNILPYYAKWGQQFIQKLYDHSLTLEQEFVVLVVAD